MPRYKELHHISLSVFEKLYENYYSILCLIAFDLVRNKQVAEEIVDEVFISLWQKHETIEIHTSIRAYLIKSVQNRCFNWFEETKTERLIVNSKHDISECYMIKWSDDYPLGNLLEKELDEIIHEAISALPKQCQKIFLLSRDEELNYEEIAAKLSLSVNTVKTQMKIALSKLREALKDYLPFLVILL